MNLNVLRDFWINVIGVDKPKTEPARPKIDLEKPKLKLKIPRRHPADDVQDIENQAAVADQQAAVAEQEAEAAEQKAEVMERLAALVGPYKQAVADDGPDAQQLKTLFKEIKGYLGQQQYTTVTEGLDLLQELLDAHTSASSAAVDEDDGDDDDVRSRKDDVGEDNEQRIQDAPSSGDANSQEGGTDPQPQTQPTADVNASCLINIVNNTKAVLTLTNQSNERGDFMTNPANSVQPGASTSFAYVQTPQEKDPNQKSCKGSVTWDVGSPATASWRCEWDNPVGEKNTAQASVDPQGAGFKSLAQIGQGDENVPVTFTISGGGQGPDPVKPVDPPVKPPVDPPVDPPEVEPDYNPPVAEKQPTLRIRDNNKDGWVEYLQQLLNSWLGTKLPTNGDFDQATLKAVREFQGTHDCQVDGIVGNQTWAALRQGKPEKPSTDGRKPHTFEETGAKVRWYTEHVVGNYVQSEDKAELGLCAVGEQDVEGQPAHVFVTVPGGQKKGLTRKIGGVYKKTADGEGNLHLVTIEKFTEKFPIPDGATVEQFVMEAYFEQDLGGDYWTGNLRVK